MALLRKSGMDKILKRIMETGGLSDSMEEDINRLRADYDEREGMLSKYGEFADTDNEDEYEFKEKQAEPEETVVDDPNDWKGKYDELKSKYISRYFGGDTAEASEIIQEQTEDIRRDGTVQSFDELLQKVEG